MIDRGRTIVVTGRSKIPGEGRFLLEGEEVFRPSRVGIRKELPSPKYYSIKRFRS